MKLRIAERATKIKLLKRFASDMKVGVIKPGTEMLWMNLDGASFQLHMEPSDEDWYEGRIMTDKKGYEVLKKYCEDSNSWATFGDDEEEG